MQQGSQKQGEQKVIPGILLAKRTVRVFYNVSQIPTMLTPPSYPTLSVINLHDVTTWHRLIKWLTQLPLYQL